MGESDMKFRSCIINRWNNSGLENQSFPRSKPADINYKKIYSYMECENEVAISSITFYLRSRCSRSLFSLMSKWTLDISSLTSISTTNTHIRPAPIVGSMTDLQSPTPTESFQKDIRVSTCQS